jgi:Mg2+/Co2+ transporter CorB
VLDLADYEVGDIMTHRKAMAMIDAGEPAPTIVEKALASPFTRIPLWREKPDNIVGILNTKSLLRGFLAHTGDPASFDPAAFATPPWFVPDTTKLIDQLRVFRDRREHMAMVVDEYGTLMGLITLEDVVEEIVGDIFDEHETALPGVRREPDGSYVVRGTVTVRELNRQFNWRLPEEEAATIAGLVIREARIIPEPGQRFTFHDFGFEILRRQRNQLTSLRVTPPATAAPELAA